MRIASKIEKFISICETATFYAAVVTLAAMMFMLVLDATLRYAFRKPLAGVYELTQFSLVVLIALPLAFTQRIKAHISAGLVIERLRGTSRIAVELLTAIIGLILFSIATWATGRGAVESYVTHDYTWGLVEFVLWPVKSLIPLGCGLLCLRLIIDIVQHIHSLVVPEKSRAYSEHRT